MPNLLITVLSPTLPSPLDWLPIICRIIALAIAAPFLFVTLLEVTAYLIVRTLGFSSLPMTRAGVPVDPNKVVPLSKSQANSSNSSPLIVPTPLSSDISAISTPLEVDIPAPRAAPSMINIPTPSPRIERPPIYFATPGEHDFKLSGTGLFSPPDSRPGSPHQSKSVSDASSDSMSSSGDEDSMTTSASGIVVHLPPASRPTTDGAEIRSRHSGMRRGLASMTPIEAR